MINSGSEPEEQEVLTTPALPLIIWLISLLLVAVQLRRLVPVYTEDPSLFGPIIAYIVAELFSPSLAGFGRFPLSATALLVVVVCPKLGFLPWLFLVLAGFCIRFISSRLRSESLLSLISDSLPEIWVGLAVWSVPEQFQIYVAGFMYFLIWQLQPGLFAQAVPGTKLALWSLARERSVATVAFLCLLGSGLSGVVINSPALGTILLLGLPLLRVTIAAQVKVLGAEVEARKQARVERSQKQTSKELNVLQSKVELQRLEVELQHRVLTLVGELFMETSIMQSPSDLRSALLGFVRRVIPCQRIALYELGRNGLYVSVSQGPEHLKASVEDLEKMSTERVKAFQLSREGAAFLSAPIPQRGLMVVSDTKVRWDSSHHHLLSHLAKHLPICLDAVRYREMQSQVLADEQSRRLELDQLAFRLTATLDLLGELVSCYSLEELLQAAQQRLPRIIPGFVVKVCWREYVFAPENFLHDVTADYCFQLHASAEELGQLSLFGDDKAKLTNVDIELLRLFSVQLASLIEGAELNARLVTALEQVKTSQAKVIQSSKMAAIGQLAAGVAHELNTPLGAVSIAVELSIETLESSPQKTSKRLEKAMESIDQMRSIIAKLLHYSRDSQKLRSSVNLYKVMDDSLQLVAHTLKMAGIEVDVQSGPPVVLEANANELQQVLSNLLINAKDACTSPGTSRKRIEMWLEEQKEQVLIHVQDYGCGMSEETMQRAFEPFYTTKAVGEGTGLGLSTSLELVHQHNGTLTCQSQLGQGTHFIVTLPLNL